MVHLILYFKGFFDFFIKKMYFSLHKLQDYAIVTTIKEMLENI